jgi:hypothetical protein
MNKRILSLTLSLLTLMTFMFVLSACGASKLSGTYTSADGGSTSLVFDGSKVTLYEDGVQLRNGTFTESAKTASGYLLRITYEGTSAEERYWLNESRDTISYNVEGKNEQGQTVNDVGDAAFKKEN